jgi:hypothetical protein
MYIHGNLLVSISLNVFKEKDGSSRQSSGRTGGSPYIWLWTDLLFDPYKLPVSLSFFQEVSQRTIGHEPSPQFSFF